jgi:hypothetical protein
MATDPLGLVPVTGSCSVVGKLLVALWRYLETGVVPQGAVLKG